MVYLKEAAEAKEKGNECMKKGKLMEAILLYTQSLKCDASSHLVYSNRCLAFLKEQQYFLAMEDANKCIQLQPKWPKGHFRKGEIEFHTGNYLAALRSYSNALNLDPTDEGIKTAVNKASRELNKAKKAASRLPWTFTIVGALIGAVIVLADQCLTSSPSIPYIFLKISVVGTFGVLGLLAAKGYRYISDNQKSALLESPPDLFGVNETKKDEEGDTDAKTGENYTHKKGGQASARQRYKMGKS